MSRLYLGDSGINGNIITEMLTKKEWDLLHMEYIKTGSLSLKTWQLIRESCQQRYEENKYKWVFGNGIEYV
jgi:hypothetical protein